MAKYRIRLKVREWDFSATPPRTVEIHKDFNCENWAAAEDLISSMMDATDSLSLDIDKKEE